MLCINRKYVVSVGLSMENEITAKLNELDISIINKQYHGGTFCGIELKKVYFDCMSSETKMNSLIEYLQLSFDGVASIIY